MRNTLALAFFLLATSAAQAQSAIEKLPLSINAPGQSQLLPVISADGRTLYFTRTRMGLDSEVVFDVWMSHVLGDTGFSDAEFLGGNLASSYGIAVTSIAPDNNSLYLIGKLKSDSPPDERVYVSHRTSSGWSIPEAIHIPGLHARGIYTDYSFGPDQKTLVMSVDRDSTLGDRDLYVSFYNETAHTWSMPLWLGADINSHSAEMTPYLASDNKTLYFSSDRFGGNGDVDVYRSFRLDDSWQHWSRPEELGTGINRNGRTTFYTEDAEGKFAYFSWRASTSDPAYLYRARVSHGRAVALVHGIVSDAHGKPLFARVRYERLSDGKELGSARSDPSSGAFQLSLPAGEDYALRAEKDGYFPTSEHIDLRTLNVFESLDRDLKLSKIEAGTAIALRNVFFETDKAMLLPASFPELGRVKELLQAHPEYKLEIAGHTDSLGSEQHNQQLGKSRAEAVREYLVQQGIEGSRLTAKSYGSSKPVATNATDEGRAMNRRVEFVIEP
ncbi:MAG: OmpA family protein [Bacteroidota bacterium]|nr:OmpA family protein [Bacteroidota bacterium]MDP4233103.1 OmpA family protein [Bacteroidota bacterium]MDP4241752.1 OmpA family protein [Bacteroidota bacterium]MDP4287410.1 OmpA family protein [Bacteroidota bacterium]